LFTVFINNLISFRDESGHGSQAKGRYNYARINEKPEGTFSKLNNFYHALPVITFFPPSYLIAIYLSIIH